MDETNNFFVEIRDALRRFAEEREWGQFHTPKNLAVSLSVEAAELLENFQWLSVGDSTELGANRLSQVRHEIADVLICAIGLADKLGIELHSAIWEKIEINRKKYPVEKVKGSAKKYTEY